MTTTEISLRHRVAPVAAALGEGWVAIPGNWREDAYLAGPDGERIHVRIDTWHKANAGKFFFSGSSGDDLHGHTYGLDGFRDVGVSTEKSPELIAKDITRRLLPKYRDALRVARERKAASDDQDARRDALAAQIASALGEEAENSGTGVHHHRNDAHVRIGKWGAPVDATFEVPTGEYEVKVEIRVSKDLAVYLAAFVGDLSRGEVGL